MTTIELDGMRLTRVLYVDITVPPETVSLTADEVRSVPWAEPAWTDGDQVRVSASAWVVEADGRRVVIDPMMAADPILHDPDAEAAHRDAIAAAFATSGLPVESIDAVAFTHIEGIGMAAARDEAGAWQPTFPNATVLVSEEALRAFETQSTRDFTTDAWDALLARDRVRTFADGDEIVPDLRAELDRAHDPGHCVFHAGTSTTFVGHLALTPLHLAVPPKPGQHRDIDAAWAFLQRIAADDRTLIGPLWPTPAHGRWTGSEFVSI